MTETANGWRAESASVIRTQRRLMDGYVYASAARTPGMDALQAAAE